MKRHTPGRHRARFALPRPVTGTAAVAAAGLLVATLGAAASTGPTPPATTPDATTAPPAVDDALSGISTDKDRPQRLANQRVAETAADSPAQAAPAPAPGDAAHTHFGELGFTGITPEPEPAVAEPDTTTEDVTPASEDGSDTQASAAQAREEASASSRSQPREEAPTETEAPEEEQPTEPDAPEEEQPPTEPDTPEAQPPGGQGAESAIAWAQANLGLPYQWGSNSGGAYDCSGFTTAAFRSAGITIPHGSEAQYHATSRIPLSQMQRGDLLFYSKNGSASGIFHVGIYLGDGQVIHSLRDGSGFNGSKINGINYASGLMAAGRP